MEIKEGLPLEAFHPCSTYSKLRRWSINNQKGYVLFPGLWALYENL